MIPLNLEQIQEKVLHILLEFAEFCKDNNLRYYLAGGTLLGAIRHQGFIPWDEDADVCMPRPDYDRFLRIAPPYFIARGLLVQNGFSPSLDVSFPYCKIYDLKSRATSIYRTDINYLGIDIFPVDGVPDDPGEAKRLFNQVSFWKRILLLTSARIGEGRTLFRKIFKVFPKLFADLIGARRCLKHLQVLSSQYSYDTSNYVAAITGSYNVKEILPKKDYEKDVIVTFEGHKLSAFSCWDTYLTNIYGNYMKMPDETEKKRFYSSVYYG